jgi:ferredoxin-NADP reductase
MSQKIRVQRSRELNPVAKSISFSRPEGFDFLPGQHALFYINKDGARPFTMTSSPLDRRLIEFGIKRVGDFTSKMFNLKKGDEVEITGPLGTFFFEEEIKDDLVFIAGGSGITPFISMMRYIEDKNLKNKITLIYSVKKSDEIMFLGEIERIKENGIINKVVYTVTGEDPEWDGERGRISERIIKGNVTDPKNKVYFICGPPEFEKAVSGILRDLQIRRKRVKSAAWG